MSDLFNLDAVVSEAADKGPFRFQFGGEEYQLPPDMNIIAAAAMADGEIYQGLQLLLGQDQWKRMRESDAVLTDSMLGALFTAYQEHMGVGLGESSASTASSKPTVKPSRRTSNGVTRLP